MANSADIINIDSDDDALIETNPVEEKDKNKQAERALKRFIDGLGRAEGLGLPAMVEAVEAMALHKNTTPAAKLMTFFIRRGLKEERIFAGVIRSYFGDRVVTGRKDESTPLGYVFNVKGFAKGIAPRNTWAQVTDHMDRSIAYNSATFKNVLKDMFVKDEPKEEGQPDTNAERDKALKAYVRDVEKARAQGVSLETLMTQLRLTYGQAVVSAAA